MLPSNAAREDEVRHADPGVFPPLPQRGPLLGKGHRGWARISAGETVSRTAPGRKARAARLDAQAGLDLPVPDGPHEPLVVGRGLVRVGERELPDGGVELCGAAAVT